MTNDSEISAEEARKEWMEKATETWRVSAEIIRKHESIIKPLKVEFARFKIADFCSWVITTYPQVRFLALDLDIRDIEVYEIYDADKSEIEDADNVISDAIQEYVNERFYRFEFRDFSWSGGDIDIEMLNLKEISQWRP